MKTERRFVPTPQETRSLEAVFRLNSISEAARELNLSQPTISYHINKLEDKWGTRLFHNKNGRIESTEFLRSIISEVRSVAHQLEHIGYLVGSQGRKKELCIGLPPALASIVLLQRLGEFQAIFPHLNIRIRADNRFQNLEQERIDVSLRLLPRPADARARIDASFFTPVADERMRLVCAPHYFASISEEVGPGEHGEILSRAQLIHEDETQHFARYLSTYWRDLVLTEQSVLTLNNADLILQTAIAGRGFALLREVYVMDALREKLLVEPFPHRLDCERVFHFVAPEAIGFGQSARDFVNWFGAELRSLVGKPTTACVG